MGMNKIEIVKRHEERQLLEAWFASTSFDKPSEGIPKLAREEDDDEDTKADDAFELEFKVRHVRTPAGARRYGQPIGSIIVRDTPLRNLQIRDRVYSGWERVADSRGNEYDVGKRDNRWIATRAGEWDELESGSNADDVYRALDERAGRGGGRAVPKPRAARATSAPVTTTPSRAKTPNYTREESDDPNYEKYKGADGKTYWAVKDPASNEWVLLDDDDNELDSAKSKAALLKKLNTRAAAPEAPAAQPARTPRAARATPAPASVTPASPPAAGVSADGLDEMSLAELRTVARSEMSTGSKLGTRESLVRAIRKHRANQELNSTEQAPGRASARPTPAPAASGVSRETAQIRAHNDAPVSIDIVDSQEGRITGRAHVPGFTDANDPMGDDQSVYISRSRGGPWTAQIPKTPSRPQATVTARSPKELGRRIADHFGVSGTISIEDEVGGGRGGREEYTPKRRTSPASTQDRAAVAARTSTPKAKTPKATNDRAYRGTGPGPQDEPRSTVRLKPHQMRVGMRIRVMAQYDADVSEEERSKGRWYTIGQIGRESRTGLWSGSRPRTANMYHITDTRGLEISTSSPGMLWHVDEDTVRGNEQHRVSSARISGGGREHVDLPSSYAVRELGVPKPRLGSYGEVAADDPNYGHPAIAQRIQDVYDQIPLGDNWNYRRVELLIQKSNYMLDKDEAVRELTNLMHNTSDAKDVEKLQKQIRRLQPDGPLLSAGQAARPGNPNSTAASRAESAVNGPRVEAVYLRDLKVNDILMIDGKMVRVDRVLGGNRFSLRDASGAVVKLPEGKKPQRVVIPAGKKWSDFVPKTPDDVIKRERAARSQAAIDREYSRAVAAGDTEAAARAVSGQMTPAEARGNAWAADMARQFPSVGRQSATPNRAKLHGQIIASYQNVRGNRDWTLIRDVRDDLVRQGFTAEEVDASLRQMGRGGYEGVYLAPIAAGASRMRHRGTGVVIGDEEQLVMRTDDEKSFAFATEVKDILDGFEVKAVRYVRTPSGAQRFGQPIGSIIVRDGASPLSNLRAVAGNRLLGSDGTRYRVGQSGGRWEARAEGGNEAVVRGDSQEQVLTRLNAHAADSESGRGSGRSGDSGSDNAPTRQNSADHAEHGEAYKAADGKTYYIKGEDDDYVIRDKDGNVIGKKRDKGEALKELERFVSSSTGAGPADETEAPASGGDDEENAPTPTAPSGGGNGPAPNTPASRAAIERQLQRLTQGQLRQAAQRNGLRAGPQASRESLIATLLKFLIKKLLGQGQQQGTENTASYGVLLELKHALEDLEEKIRHVRTAAGAARYGLPIGSVIPEGGKPRLGAGINSKPKRTKLSTEMREHRDGFKRLHARLIKKPETRGMAGSVMSLVEQIDAGEIVNEDQLMGVVARLFTPDQFGALLANMKSFGPLLELKTLIDVKADQKTHTGAMVALIPSRTDAVRLYDRDGEGLEELHVTLAFLGKAADISESARYAIIGNIAALAGQSSQPHAEAFSVNVFNPNGEEPCVVMGINGKGPALNDMHNHTLALLGDVEAQANWRMPEQHSPWVPHITLRYFEDGEVDREWLMDQFDKTGPVTFDRIRVAFGGNNIDFPLAEAMAPEKAEAKAMRDMPKTEQCKFGTESATKRLVWEGRAYIATCDDHQKQARNELRKNGDRPVWVYSMDGEKIGEMKKLVITPGGRVGDDSSHNISPRENWVEKRGGLPKYIRTIANGIREKRGTSEERAIALAVAAVRRWASGRGNVSPKVRAAAAAAAAQFESMRAGKSFKSVGSSVGSVSSGSAGMGAAPAKPAGNHVSNRMAEGGRIADTARRTLARDPQSRRRGGRYVASAAGARRYGKPIGSEITAADRARVEGRSARGGKDSARTLSAALKKRLPIAYGQQGPVVMQVQMLVGKLGFPTEEDGIFGDKTQTAVKAAQKKLGLKPTGKIDEATMVAFFEAVKPRTSRRKR